MEDSPLTERLLHLTMEIIHILTGEKCAVVKMVSIENLLQGMYPPCLSMSGKSSRSPSMIPKPPFMISEINNDKRILEVIQKMMELLMGEAWLEECGSLWKIATMDNPPTLPSADLSGRAETMHTSCTVKKEQNVFHGGFNMEVDYTMRNIKEEDLLDGDCSTPGTSPLAKTIEDSAPNIIIPELERPPDIAHIKEELGVDGKDSREDKGGSLNQQVDSSSPLVKDSSMTGNLLVTFGGGCIGISEPDNPYWPPSQSTEAYEETSESFHRQPMCQGPPSFFCGHQPIHTGPERHACLQCEQTFCTKSQLVVHRKVHTGEKPFSFYVRQQLLDSPATTHPGQRTHVCSECGRSFTRNSLLVIHQRIHSGEKPYSCLECNRSFRHKSALVAHQRTHTGERPYRCSACGKCYTHSSHLVIHQRSHSGEKPYSCLECGKAFTHKSALVRHQRIHTGDPS